jgi:hypothetical protein
MHEDLFRLVGGEPHTAPHLPLLTSTDSERLPLVPRVKYATAGSALNHVLGAIAFAETLPLRDLLHVLPVSR